MLAGITRKQIDAKGRLSLPKRLRDCLFEKGRGELVVLKVDRCLQVYSINNWNKIQKSIEDLSPFKADTRQLQRMWGYSTEIIELDIEGRLVLPPELKNYAGIDRDVVIIGALTRVEIWSSERWEEVNSNLPSLEELANGINLA